MFLYGDVNAGRAIINRAQSRIFLADGEDMIRDPRTPIRRVRSHQSASAARNRENALPVPLTRMGLSQFLAKLDRGETSERGGFPSSSGAVVRGYRQCGPDEQEYGPQFALRTRDTGNDSAAHQMSKIRDDPPPVRSQNAMFPAGQLSSPNLPSRNLSPSTAAMPHTRALNASPQPSVVLSPAPVR